MLIIGVALGTFSSCDGVIQGLHSVPTRRSSDLRRSPARCIPSTTAPSCVTSWPDRARAHDRPDPRRGRGADRRSEEHTSELQSPCNLVCRLLLEKNNCISCLFREWMKLIWVDCE